MASKYLQKFPIPVSFPAILEDLTREILREQPRDIIAFAAKYFRSKADGLEFDWDDPNPRAPKPVDYPRTKNAMRLPDSSSSDKERPAKMKASRPDPSSAITAHAELREEVKKANEEAATAVEERPHSGIAVSATAELSEEVSQASAEIATAVQEKPDPSPADHSELREVEHSQASAEAGTVEVAKAVAKSPVMRLYYFNVRNRAEFIRWMFAYKHIEYEDIRIEFADWDQTKPTFEFHQVPVLEIDGRQLVTAIAIGRHIALKHGLYPSDSYEVYSAESLIDFVGDFLSVYDKLAFKEANWAGWDEYLCGEGVQRLKIAEARLKANQGGAGFFIGSAVSMVDFVVAAYVHSHYFLAGQEHRLTVLSQEVPALKAFVDHFLGALPDVAHYIGTRPESMG
jgi:glutathione S-transferase